MPPVNTRSADSDMIRDWYFLVPADFTSATVTVQRSHNDDLDYSHSIPYTMDLEIPRTQ